MQTTSGVNACDAVIQLDNAAGSLKDISGSSNKVGMELTNELGVLHTFGSRFPVRLECKSDAALSLSSIYSTDDAEALEILKDWYYTTRGSKTLRVNVPDESVGSDRYEFEVFLESLKIDLPADEAAPVLVEAALKPTGTFSVSTIAS